MTPRTQYTDARKKQLVARCFKAESVTKVSEATGINAGNLRQWCRNPNYGGKPTAFANSRSLPAAELPTTRTVARKPKALVPTHFACPHCGGAIALETS